MSFTLVSMATDTLSPVANHLAGLLTFQDILVLYCYTIRVLLVLVEHYLWRMNFGFVFIFDCCLVERRCQILTLIWFLSSGSVRRSESRLTDRTNLCEGSVKTKTVKFDKLRLKHSSLFSQD